MSRILRSTDIRSALRSRQRGFILNPYQYAVAGPGVFNTIDPVNRPGGTLAPTLSNGNRTWTTNTTSGVNASYFTPNQAIPTNAKIYFEFTVNQLRPDAAVGYLYVSVGAGYIWWVYGNLRQIVGTNTTAIPAGADGMICSVAANNATGKVWYGRGGVWYTTGTGTPDPAADTGAAATFTPNAGAIPQIQGRSGSAAQIVTFNFGQAAYAYSVPSGFGNY